MIVTNSNNTYRITYDGVSMVENALDNPNLVQISTVVGCTILVAPQNAEGAFERDPVKQLIAYLPNGEYRRWTLTGKNTRLARQDAHFIYARLNRNGSDALLVFSVNDYKVDGSLNLPSDGGDAEDTATNPPSENYFYIKIGSITETNEDYTGDATVDRIVSLDTGYLNTDSYRDEGGSGALSDMFRIVSGNLILALKRLASFTVQGTLTIIGKLVLNDKPLSGVARNDDEEVLINDETVPTTAYLRDKFLDFLRDKFIRKDRPDETKYLVKFFDGLMAGLYAEGERSGSCLHPDGLAELGSLQVNGTSEFRDNLSSEDFVSGFTAGKGWAMQLKKYLNAAGVEETLTEMELDNLIVRKTLKVFEFIVSQMLGENDNRTFSGFLKVHHYDAATGRIYLKTEDGQMYNPFRRDDILYCQQFNGMPSEENDFTVVKTYELLVTDAQMGSLDDGENRLDWVTFKNFVGDDLSLIAEDDVLVRLDNLTNPDRKGIIQLMTVGNATPYMDIIYGRKTDPDNALKSRFGNLQGIYNHLFGWLKGFGAYIINAYAVGEFRLAHTGEDVADKFEITEGKFRTNYRQQTFDITEEDNYFTNATFGDNLRAWVPGENGIDYFTAGDAPVYLNRNVYTSGEHFVGLAPYSGKDMLRILDSSIKQLSADIRMPGTHKEYIPDAEEGSGQYDEVPDTLYLTIRYICTESGELEFGFENSGDTSPDAFAFVSMEVSKDVEYHTLQYQGTWNGIGDFIIRCTGEVYIDMLSLTDRPLDNFKTEVFTKVEQDATRFAILGQKIDNVEGRVTNLGIELNSAEERITLYVDSKNDELVQDIASINIAVGQITSRVSTLEDDVEIAYSQITQTNSRITSEVASLENSIEIAYSQITQTNSRITSEVASLENSIETAYTRIEQTADRVSVIGKNFDSNGNVLSSSGIVTTSTFSSLFASAFDNEDVVTSAELSVYVKKDNNGYLESGVKIYGDKIDMKGMTSINETFAVDMNGKVTIGDFEVTETGLRNVRDTATIVYSNSAGRIASLGDIEAATWRYFKTDGSWENVDCLVSSVIENNAIGYEYSMSAALQVAARNSSERNAAIIATAGSYLGFRISWFVPDSLQNVYSFHFGNAILFMYSSYNTCYLPPFTQEDDGIVLFVKSVVNATCYIVPYSGYRINYDQGTVVVGTMTFPGTVNSDYTLKIHNNGDAMMLIYRHANKTFYQWKNPPRWTS